MDREDGPYENYVKGGKCGIEFTDRNAMKTQSSGELAESDSVKTRSSRAALVCLVLLCFLLLTAVVVLCVFIYTNNTNYTQERNQLLTRITNITEVKDELLARNTKLTEERDQLQNGWICYKSSLCFASSDAKSWTDSRSSCTMKGADLIIINNRPEQDYFLRFAPNEDFWIGVTDSDVEGRWRWVDGSTVTSGFWAFTGGTGENCA